MPIGADATLLSLQVYALKGAILAAVYIETREWRYSRKFDRDKVDEIKDDDLFCILSPFQRIREYFCYS